MASLSGHATWSAFPFLTPEEFESSCRAFLDRVHVLGDSRRVGWSSIRLVQQTTGPILKISRTIEDKNYDTLPELADPQDPQLEACEDDPEALIRTSHHGACLEVDYDIILSPTYRVPVLYFTLRRGSHPGPLGIDTVYQYLVPDQYKKELQSVGVMGGISLGYHPESGAPAFFVHPCNTADAMRHIAEGQTVVPETYFFIWLGLVGNCLGLHLPYELFATKSMQEPEGIK